MPVHGGARGRHGRGAVDARGARDVADEPRLEVAVSGRQPVGSGVEPRARGTGAGEVVRDGERAGDPTEDLVVDPVLHRGDGERRRVAVADRGEGVVADVEHPLGEVALAGDGEVPRQVEVAPTDAGVAQRGEQVLEVRAALLDRRAERRDPVAVQAEGAAGRDHRAGCVAQVAQRDDEPVPLGEVARGPDDQHRTLGGIGLRVELREEGLPLTGGGVEEHDRLVGIERRADVGDRGGSSAREVETRDLREDRGARAEPVVAVPLGRVDVDAARVRRHRGHGEAHPPAGVGRRVGRPCRGRSGTGAGTWRCRGSRSATRSRCRRSAPTRSWRGRRHGAGCAAGRATRRSPRRSWDPPRGRRPSACPSRCGRRSSGASSARGCGRTRVRRRAPAAW